MMSIRTRLIELERLAKYQQGEIRLLRSNLETTATRGTKNGEIAKRAFNAATVTVKKTTVEVENEGCFGYRDKYVQVSMTEVLSAVMDYLNITFDRVPEQSPKIVARKQTITEILGDSDE